MNSYFKMNRDYRELYLMRKDPKRLEEAERGGRFYPLGDQIVVRYPENINLKEFLLFQLYPTLTYQDSYPLSRVECSTFTWILNLATRLMIICLGLVSSF